MANKRIKDLSEKSALASGDYLAIDNDNGTKKVNASGILSSISSASSAASSASTAASRAQNWIRSTSNFPTGDAYSTTSSYKVGDLVIYSNTLYRCKTACSAGSWSTNQSNFEQTTLAGAITDVNEALNDKIEYYGNKQIIINVAAGGSQFIDTGIKGGDIFFAATRFVGSGANAVFFNWSVGGNGNIYVVAHNFEGFTVNGAAVVYFMKRDHVKPL